MTEPAVTPWVAAERAAKAEANRVFLPVEVTGAPGLIVLPSRTAYRLDVTGTRRRLIPKGERSKKMRRRVRDRVRAEIAKAKAFTAAADASVALSASIPIAREILATESVESRDGETPCSQA